MPKFFNPFFERADRCRSGINIGLVVADTDNIGLWRAVRRVVATGFGTAVNQAVCFRWNIVRGNNRHNGRAWNKTVFSYP